MKQYKLVKCTINGKEVEGGIQGYNYLPKSGLLKIDAPFGWG